MGNADWKDGPSWLEATGSEPGTVLSSRVRLARNLQGHRFTHRANPDEKAQVFELVRDSIRQCDALGSARVVRIDRTTPIDQQHLVERHLISNDLAEGQGARGVVIGEDESISVMINEEDHLRIQVLLSGLEPLEAWRVADRVDNDLAGALEIAYSEEWGFLTACTTNTGTGLRASILIHLPALVLTKQIGKVLRGISQVGLAVRGMFGEGSDVMGNFFQVSNQTTLGQNEVETIDSLIRVTRQIIDHERNASEVLMKNARLQVEDKVFRSYGILSQARVISSEEVLSLASAVRFGTTLGLLDGPDPRVLNRLMIETRPAHLQKEAGEKLRQAERDFQRAALVRRLLTENTPDEEVRPEAPPADD